ncbi:MAG: hypothetical protein LUG51_16665 [Tannerellaceae bacterium]|nr:hypothetical protein [Tannerellaceae bacterium]
MFLCNKVRLIVWILSALLIGCFAGSPAAAQIPEKVFSTDHRIDPDKKGQLSVEIDNISFFKNNEYEGKFLKGYTLPGFWLQAKAVYHPLKNIRLEAGIHGLRYWGADKYPNYGYQDIANWKSNKYQRGAHVLPYIRAQVALSDQVNLVFGNIYGGSNHKLIEPMYSPELNLTADPEVGLQLLYDSRYVDLDLWVDWQSFIFDLDDHQEAFIVGLSSRIKFNSPDSRWHVYIPVQGVAQHRGGEINTIYKNSVQTFMNGAAGVGLVWNANRGVLKNINFEYDVAGYYQQAGSLWPLDTGNGKYVRLSADVYDFRIKTSYWECDDFISILGSPFYGAVSTKEEGVLFDKPAMVYFGLEYCRNFGKGFALGIDLDIYNHLPVNSVSSKERIREEVTTSFSAGIYLRINPSFFLKKF